MRRIKLWTFKWTPPLLLHHPKGSRMGERIDFPIPCQSSMSTVPLISIRLVSCFTFLRKVIRLFWESEFFCFFVFFFFFPKWSTSASEIVIARAWLAGDSWPRSHRMCSRAPYFWCFTECQPTMCPCIVVVVVVVVIVVFP